MKKQLTKLQKVFIDEHTKKGDVIAFPVNVFTSKKYKEWRKSKRIKK